MGEHEGICTLPFEGVKLTDQFNTPEDLGWERNWIFCEDYLNAFPIGDNKMTKNLIEKDWSIFYKGQSILLEKSISHTARIPWLKRNFNNAKFIGITRNGYASIEGMNRKAEPKGEALLSYGKDRYEPKDMGRQWVSSNERLFEHIVGRSNGIMVQYESLVAHFNEVIPFILEFLDLEQTYKFDIENSKVHCASGRVFHLVNGNPSSIAKVKSWDLTDLNKIIGPMMLKLGYKLISQ